MQFEEKLLRERLDSVDADQKLITSIIADRTKLSETEISGLFLEALSKDTAHALNAGIVDEVRDVDVSDGKPVVLLVSQREGVVQH